MFNATSHENLLTSTIDDRMAYFSAEIVPHPLFDFTLDYLNQNAYPLLGRRLILLLGGSGVGKTAVMQALVKRRAAQRIGIATDKQHVPAILMEARAPDEGKFRFASIYRAVLKEMGAALVSRSLPTIERQAKGRTLRTVATEEHGKRLNADALTDRFHENLIDRKTEIICIDEAINIFKVGASKSELHRKRQLEEQADKLKTLVNQAPISIVLAGAYDFFDMTLVSGQIARRSLIIHMEPYPSTKEGLKGFATALMHFFERLQHVIVCEFKIEDIAAELFLQTLGCVGTLRDLLLLALHRSLSACKPLTIRQIRECYLPAAQLEVMRDQNESGAKKVAELMSTAEMAQHVETVRTSQMYSGNPIHNLKPGDTTPSHRKEAAERWKE